MKKSELSIYIHIPFCRSKCKYCDFNSYAGKEELIPAYFDAMNRDLRQYEADYDKYVIRTAFFGGGTPSLVNADLIADFLAKLKSCFEFSGDAEISVECNPGTLKSEALCKYKEAGINRISIGLQCWQDPLLRKLGRIHSAEDFEITMQYVKEAGFSNINADLIFGIPGQTMNNWKESLKKVIDLEVPHLSCYSLTIEEDTEFGEMLKRGELPETDDETDREMYHYAVGFLKAQGFRHYEISNFSKRGFECRHNLVYWNCGKYIGLGAGAHSYYNNLRYNNQKEIEGYIDAFIKGRNPAENFENIDTGGQRTEYMILGLRTAEGINSKDFREKFGSGLMTVYGEKISRLADRGLLLIEDTGIKLSEKGLDFANQVFMEFI